ncbi:DEHA2G07810p [Debaryomyces hansenii CBS767]|uniref:DEHA2G07810p n=1 Tax=Debaryomyces hansenii (strain ATCC 36239 / CBS 767 / BCRC 21394 / JCM 1990 / NBRC 0083 / IGC 2968) TaxID=284592 RepID=Q6BIT4_DEBHA|nr:DEHA2G07810p [Debaryomyces hansenii CBS767]CAG90350.2 DEHA2G07810p [Debaryomyces hansenii CBS767]|eukprot:XP_461887.2 DEHA2G07810p [Debaryomyces hansenii CBS767]
MSSTNKEPAGSAPANPTDSINPANNQNNIVPRDVRLLHLIFATQGIQNYQDHVPLQLMDFAHRYTTSVLKDALIYNDHAKPLNSNTNINSSANSTVNTDDIRLAIAARTNYQFKPTPPKELLLELAHERNSKPLPPVIPKWGLNLPPEKYCLTARDWENLEDEFTEGEKETPEAANKKSRLR